jgi:hypothetical protein
MTGEEHNRNIAWAFIAHGSFQILFTLVMMLFFGFIFSLPPTPGRGAPANAILWPMLAFFSIFQAFFVVPSFVAAWGLLKQRSWARMASITAGVIAAMNVPLGTLAAIYSLWFFLGDKWKNMYSEATPSDEKDSSQLLADLHTRWTGMKTDEKGEVIFHHVEPPDWR